MMRNVSLKEMFDILVDCILNNKEQPVFYYRFEYEENHFDMYMITEVDLMRGRLKTINDDFSEYEWELKKSNIYIWEDNNGKND